MVSCVYCECCASLGLTKIHCRGAVTLSLMGGIKYFEKCNYMHFLSVI